jgi:hypothetical protein
MLVNRTARLQLTQEGRRCLGPRRRSSSSSTTVIVPRSLCGRAWQLEQLAPRSAPLSVVEVFAAVAEATMASASAAPTPPKTQAQPPMLTTRPHVSTVQHDGFQRLVAVCGAPRLHPGPHAALAANHVGVAAIDACGGVCSQRWRRER